MGGKLSSPLPHTHKHTFSFVDENNISKEYNNNVSVSTIVQEPLPKINPSISANSYVGRLLIQRKTALRASHASAGKKTSPCSQTVRRTTRKLVIKPDNRVRNGINQSTHPVLSQCDVFF